MGLVDRERSQELLQSFNERIKTKTIQKETTKRIKIKIKIKRVWVGGRCSQGTHIENGCTAHILLLIVLNRETPQQKRVLVV